jgi:hypothetical protein
MTNKGKLFIVEFGKPDTAGGWISFGGNSQKPLYVIANNYNEAAKKAIEHAENSRENQSVLSPDGSLNLNDEKLIVKGIRLACEEIVW